MALYAFDGTWNEAKNGDDPSYENTNVARFHAAYRKHSGTTDFYVPGVGTRYDLLGRALGGVFGLGERPRIREAYDHLCTAWANGDHIIDVVGFSRGAATTLDFCHYVQEHGIRTPDTDEVVEPTPEIRFLGVWDVVAAFGLASLGSDILNIGHHLDLPRKNLKFCFHALALDERRLSFLPTRLPGACEVWFRGVHSDIGGGNGNRGLNDIALRWMFRKAQSAGLPILEADVAALAPAAVEPTHHNRLPIPVRVIDSVDRAHYTVTPLDGWTNPPSSCPVETAALEQTATEVGASGVLLLPTAVRRKMAAIWAAAETVARAHDFELDHVRTWLLTLIEGRISLVTSEPQLTLARTNMGTFIAHACTNAKRRDFRVLTEFFLNEARFELPHLYPITD